MRQFALYISSLLLLFSCTSAPKTESAKEEEEQDYSCDWNKNTPVVPIICPNDNDFFFAYQGDNDDTLCTQKVSQYTRLISNGGVQLIEYSGDNPKGQTIGYYLYGDNAKYMKGLHFRQTGGAIEGGMGFAVTEDFLENHKVIPFERIDDGNLKPMPQSVIDTIETRLGQKISRSFEYCRNLDRNIHIYNAQTVPVDSLCIGLTVLNVADQLYISTDTANYYDGSFCWNVDDDGEYLPYQISAITESEEGYDLFYYHWAPESLAMGVFLARDSQLMDINMCYYYVAIDFTPDPEEVELPNTAQLTSEYKGWKVWVNTISEATEEDSEGLSEIYYSVPSDPNKHYLLVTNANHGNDQWPTGTGKYTSVSNICGASSAQLVADPRNPEGCARCIISGCPDCRNTYNYLITLYERPLTYDLCFWFNCNMEFQGTDDEGNLMFLHYSYGDEGRYQVIRKLDPNNELISEKQVEL